MSEKKWIDAKNEVAAFREFLSVNKLPADTPRAFLLTREEIERILNQKDGDGLDGIRIYLGLQTVNNVQVPSVVIVGAEKDENGVYNDYNIPSANSSYKTTGAFRVTAGEGDDEGEGGGGTGPDTGMGVPMPCPVSCGDKNDLNNP